MRENFAGIGRALTKKLIELGARVIAVGQTQSKLDSLREELEGKPVTTVQCNLENWLETSAKLGELCANVDILVNNAGNGFNCPVEEIEECDLNMILDINLKAPINLIRMVARGMKERRSGAVVNVSSVASQAALDHHLAYGASKAALEMVTKICAKELGPYQVRVNSVNPTVVWTDMGRRIWSAPEKQATLLNKTPLARFCEIHEVIEPILFLLGSESSMITGVCLPIDGGMLAC